MLSDAELLERLRDALDDEERAGAVAYAAVGSVPAGAALGLPGIDATAPAAALLGFVDREPGANWAHGARYLLIDRESGEVTSLDARLPPFGPQARFHWRVAYRAPSVPDALVHEDPT